MGAIAVVEIPTGQPICRLPPETDVADDSPLLTGLSGEHIVEACASGTLRVRRIRDLRIEYAEQHPSEVLGPIAASAALDRWAIAFNPRQPDSQSLPGRIQLRPWPLSGPARDELPLSFGHIWALALSPNGERLAVLDAQGRSADAGLTISLISVATGGVEQRASNGAWSIHGLAWAPSGEWLVVATEDGHSLLDGRTLAPLGHLDGTHPSDAAFSPTGSFLALAYLGDGLVIPVADLESWFARS
jgi:WD40 repeat protein